MVFLNAESGFLLIDLMPDSSTTFFNETLLATKQLGLDQID